ncbi:MAG: ATP-binding cassette domain-containing protein [Sphingopyxis sp.]|nr:ATP-binding cassette domain-containing protein [Sphingopyxis sp.]
MDRIGAPGRWLLEIRQILPQHFRVMLAFSFAINILMLVSPLYMLQVYDRVLSSGSVDTLLWLTLISIFLLAIYAAAETGRRRVASLTAQALEARFAPQMFRRFEQGLDPRPELVADVQRVAKLTAVFQNGAVLAFLDLPFTPLFVAVLFLLHPILGLVGLAGAALVLALAVKAERRTRLAAQAAAESNGRAFEFISGLVRQHSAMVAMGMVIRAFDRWSSLREDAEAKQSATADAEGTYSGISKSARQIFQALVLATGAALVLANQISPGSIVASSILVGRAMAPLDQMAGGWRQLVQAAAAWASSKERLAGPPVGVEFLPLPRPNATLSINRLAVGFAGTAELVVQPFSRLAVGVAGASEPLIRPFSYKIGPGTLIALIGANGSGKTSLLQTIAGARPPAGGTISLGGRNLHDWPSSDRGPYVGYMPQDVELMQASVADNIARLGPADPDEIMAAAALAGAHEMILALAGGYDTIIGPGGYRLSSGQAQMIGLARAMFRKPALMLLDEPTANLDPVSASTALSAFRGASQEGAIVIAATHDPRVIACCDVVLTVDQGAVQAADANEYLAGQERRRTLITRKEVTK